MKSARFFAAESFHKFLSHDKGKETVLHFVEIAATEPSSDTAKAFGLFRPPDGRRLFIIFVLVTSLFLLWACCSGMVDT